MSRHIYQASRRCLYHQGQALIDNFSKTETLFTKHPYNQNFYIDEQELSDYHLASTDPYQDH